MRRNTSVVSRRQRPLLSDLPRCTSVCRRRTFGIADRALGEAARAGPPDVPDQAPVDDRSSGQAGSQALSAT
jgi:hypothetical protein